MSAAGHRALHAGLVGMVMAIAGVVSVVTASPASAHANLERSDPATGEVLAQSPSSVTMIFTEPPDPGLSAVEIVNAAGQPVQTGPVTAGAAVRSLQVGLPADLPDGIYTVSWQVLSEADGHWSADAFAFGVGVDPDTVPPPSADAATPGPSALSIAGKIALYVGIVLAIGIAVAGLWVMPGHLAARRSMTLVAGIAAVAGAVAIVLAERSTVGVSVTDLLSSTTGRNYLWLLGTAGALLACSIAAALTTGRETLTLVGLSAVATALARATGGHAAGASPALPQELAQTVHIVAIGVWIGGFLPILLLLRARRQAASIEGTGLAEADQGAPVAEVRRFSRAAGWAVLVVVLTGTVRTVGEAGGIGAVRGMLLDTSYGTTLIVKVTLVVVLIGLGALNRRRSIPRLSTDGRMLSRVLTVETAGAVTVLAATALLTGLDPEPPPAPPRPEPASISATGADFGTTLRVRLTASPGTPGPNDFDVRVTDFDSGVDAVATGVSLSFEPVGRPGIQSSQLDLRQSGSGAWVGEGTPLSLAGVWDVTTLVEIGARGVEVPLTLVTDAPGGQRISVTDVDELPDIVTITLAGGRQLQSYIDPGTAGVNDVHVTAFDAQGEELALSDLVVIMTPDDGEPRVLDAAQLSPGTPGHFTAPADLDPGEWRVDVIATGEDGSVLQGWFDQTIGAA